MYNVGIDETSSRIMLAIRSEFTVTCILLINDFITFMHISGVQPKVYNICVPITSSTETSNQATSCDARILMAGKY